MNDDELRRFVDAQEDVWPAVRAELRAGRKESHWMWFVFPQLDGLGTSDMARRYAIADAAEAEAYLRHPLLGPRLGDAAGWVLAHHDEKAEDILGPIDAVKLRSCATLFARVAGEEAGVFRDLLDTFYAGEEDPRTVALLAP